MHCLKQLSSQKSAGLDGISNRILKETAPFLTPSLTFLFNLSLRTEHIPAVWKISLVSPIYKHKGKPWCPSNYRPVALLSCVAKVFERLLSQKLLTYLLKTNLITPHQFGFLPERSTVTQLVYLVETWLKHLDAGASVASVFLDFNKAFDHVWHPGLLAKLAAAGVSDHSLAWIKDYLSDRKMIVRVGNSTSREFSTNAGVPQGSHLGPILFVVYINDLVSHIRHSTTDIYADDVTIHKEASSEEDFDLVTNDLKSADKWAESWRGAFSPEKTEALHIHRRQAIKPGTLPSSIMFNDQEIEFQQQHRHLGVVLADDLTWHHHALYIRKRVKQRCALLRLMSRHLPPKVIKTLFEMCVRPILEYASPVWGNSLTAADSLLLERLQCSIARKILGAGWLTPKTELLQMIDWPSLKWRREVQCLALFRKLLHTKHAPTASCLPRTPCTQYNLRNKHVSIRIHKSTQSTNSFFIHASILWNSLPQHITSIKSQSGFITALESYWSSSKYDLNPVFPHVLPL